MPHPFATNLEIPLLGCTLWSSTKATGITGAQMGFTQRFLVFR